MTSVHIYGHNVSNIHYSLMSKQFQTRNNDWHVYTSVAIKAHIQGYIISISLSSQPKMIKTIFLQLVLLFFNFSSYLFHRPHCHF